MTMEYGDWVLAAALLIFAAALGIMAFNGHRLDRARSAKRSDSPGIE